MSEDHQGRGASGARKAPWPPTPPGSWGARRVKHTQLIPSGGQGAGLSYSHTSQPFGHLALCARRQDGARSPQTEPQAQARTLEAKPMTARESGSEMGRGSED